MIPFAASSVPLRPLYHMASFITAAARVFEIRERFGITAADATDAQKAVVKANTTLFNRFGLASVPTVIAKHAQSGQLVTLEGSMPTARLAERPWAVGELAVGPPVR